MKARATRTAALVAYLLAAAPIGAALPATAAAQSADVLIDQGLDLRRQNRDQEALERFQQAYQMNRSPRALAQIALAEQALGSFVEAELHLQQALAVQADGWIQSRTPQLQQALTTIQARLGTIELTGGVDGAQVLVNGEVRGTLPQAAQLRVRAGSAVVEIRASGYAPVQRQVSVGPGGVARENLGMVQASANTGGGPVVQPAPGAQPVYQQQGYQGGPQTYQQQPRRQVSTHPNWTLFGVGVGLFGVPWLATWIGALASTDDEDIIGFSFIPIVGPWLLTFEIDFGFDEEFFLPFLLVIDGIAQAAGLVLTIIGLATRQSDVEVALDDGSRAPRLALRPLETDIPGAQGLSVALTHF